MFPFTSFDHKEIESFADIVSSLSKIHDHIDRQRRNPITLEAIAFAFRYLVADEFEGCLFVDCMGKRAEACLYAAAFGVKDCVSIEMYEPYISRAKLLISAFCPDDSKIDIRHGCFHDYFRFDGTIIYLDLTELQNSSDFVDDGPLLTLYLTLCSKTLPGTYCILVSCCEKFRPKEDYGFPCVFVEYSSAICRHTEYECSVFICKILSSMPSAST